MQELLLENEYYTIVFSGGEEFCFTYRYKAQNWSKPFGYPEVELDNKSVKLWLVSPELLELPKLLPNGCTEYRIGGLAAAGEEELYLAVVLRISPRSPVVRYRYEIRSGRERIWTKSSGKDRFSYMSFHTNPDNNPLEVRLSEYNEIVHSYMMSENPVSPSQFRNKHCLMGPIMVWHEDQVTWLTAYEHGSQYPDTYIGYQLHPDGIVTVEGVKGNYYQGQKLGPGSCYESVWFHIGASHNGMEGLSKAYRSFMLHDQCLNSESRKPYIFYNTWAYQERNKSWNHAKYLDSMREERILQEIDAAYRMGIEVYVIDTGWYMKTGDWEVDAERFSSGLKAVKEKLDGYGMKLGLWFDPKAAALTSRMFRANTVNLVTRNGMAGEPHPIWETEESHTLCLASSYGMDFADALIRLYHDVGVTYFKWDAISQYGCNDPRHNHGDESCSSEERGDCYAFQLPLALVNIVDRLTQSCPDAIVDFDVTEGYRAVGLSFLSAGKYFLINNGPYYVNLDIPSNRDISYDNLNVYFYPGPARGWICRTPLNYDKWIPSTLFLTHYLPDDPTSSQMINIGSLILGQNGIWGDLLTVSEEGKELIHRQLTLYKKVRDAVTEAQIEITGMPGGNPEIYEKLEPDTGRGIVVLFANSFGQPWSRMRETEFRYVTQCAVDRAYTVSGNASVRIDEEGKADITAIFHEPGAVILYFGAEE
ncbi:alpha-galactosidase [Paenibacillus sp. GCM10023252]|uniref:alpha-galactosidase n=1 Tax=Paenibacillus sp. GCM10023252 TaxID=3252649 RepID=UPI00361FA503